jgi:mannose-1-phosphate guanylyltransferase
MIDQEALLPRTTGRHELVRLAVERDHGSYRGSGGVLYDLSQEHADDDLLLVASAGQLYEESLVGLASELAARSADVAIVAYDDGSPSGWMLLRCGALRGISPHGFVDMKEQALPAIAKKHAVAVVHRATAGAVQVRTAGGYIAALRRRYAGLHGAALRGADGDLDDPYREQWRPEFAIVEEGATVSSTAALHDSVVLAGAEVNAKAVLVRCLVCPGAVVPRGQTVMDQLIDTGGSWRRSKRA